MLKNNSGFIIINKPSGPTSHDIIDKLRKITGIRRIGHAGTLDPIASGVLICGIGREATREIDKFVKLDKEYIADIWLGVETDTYDREGRVVKVDNKIPNVEFRMSNSEPDRIKKVVQRFIGKQKQVPPIFSAKKIKGKKMYQLARQGIKVKSKPVQIEIKNIEILKYDWPILRLKVNCSTGTYIRSLAHDVGRKLGWGGYLKELQRTAVGKYRIEEAVELEELSKDNYKDYFKHSK